jgi:hypothetical protein
VVDQARLESEAGDAHRVIPKPSFRNRSNNFWRREVRQCVAVNDGISRRFEAYLTQFLHNRRLHLVHDERDTVRVTSLAVEGGECWSAYAKRRVTFRRSS